MFGSLGGGAGVVGEGTRGRENRRRKRKGRQEDQRGETSVSKPPKVAV